MILYHLKKELPPFIFVWALLIGFGFGSGKWEEVGMALAGSVVLLGAIVFFLQFKNMRERVDFAEREHQTAYELNASHGCEIIKLKFQRRYLLKHRNATKKSMQKAWQKEYNKKYKL